MPSVVRWAALCAGRGAGVAMCVRSPVATFGRDATCRGLFVLRINDGRRKDDAETRDADTTYTKLSRRFTPLGI